MFDTQTPVVALGAVCAVILFVILPSVVIQATLGAQRGCLGAISSPFGGVRAAPFWWRSRSSSFSSGELGLSRPQVLSPRPDQGRRLWYGTERDRAMTPETRFAF